MSHWQGIHPCKAILATSSDGVANMSLTAKTLHMGAPIVTAFHVFSC
ncbi:AbrB family transcriptional regulator [Janthinobacterium rivuli]|uniref:AbrB family transcriptional regulator n=1 Tax=Janthinobacterium rivuli TaxID=2751478 RepID=A0ABY8I0R0_9BURK|nr:AbrB family transcriptional regulator [Janthinobacterium rivuli]WFR78453.1 AbrB family transcriptional regulator [Janthinobacterium rivuli]